MKRDHFDADTSAWIEGAPVPLEDAAAAAAGLLARSAQPLFAGLGVDIEGARAAIMLAERVGGVVEHMYSTAMLRDLDCLRETGVMLTTPGEARVRADVLLLVGDGLEKTWPALSNRLLAVRTGPDGADARSVVWLAPSGGGRLSGFDGPIEIVAAGIGATLAANLAALRACMKGRPIAANDTRPVALDALSDRLKAAKFGVAVWSAENLDPLELEMLNGLVRDLNETTRFSTLPLPAPDNGLGVLAACGWMTGFPMRTGFGSGAPLHDSWRFDAERLVSAGETDCVVWVSAFGTPAPTWLKAQRLIALCGKETEFAEEPNVRIIIGRPGLDHDAVVHSPDVGTLAAAKAKIHAPGRSAADALGRIAACLEEAGGGAC
jgi:formylmethanofuran dehydrogenase subunit B